MAGHISEALLKERPSEIELVPKFFRDSREEIALTQFALSLGLDLQNEEPLIMAAEIVFEHERHDDRLGKTKPKTVRIKFLKN